MTISLSPYMRDKVATLEMNRLRVMMVVICPSTLKPMTSKTSDGFTLPRLACPKVRIKMIVMTMVTRIKSVAPKLRAKSLRNEEWNNIGETGKPEL